MKKIDLVKLVEEVDKEEMIEGGVHKIFALTCLYKFIEMQEEAINYTHSCEALTCVKCNGYGYTVDENGRRKDHCKKCDGWG